MNKILFIICLLLSIVSCNNKKSSEAIVLNPEPIKRDTSESEMAYYRGYESYNKQDYKGAIQEFSNYLNIRRGKEKISTSDYEIYFLRAESYRVINEFNNAVNDYDVFLNYCPQDSTRKKGYLGRGSAQLGLKWYSGAENDFSKVIEFDLNNAEAYAMRGLARSCNNNQFQACEDYSKAVQLGDVKAKEYLYEFCNASFH